MGKKIKMSKIQQIVHIIVAAHCISLISRIRKTPNVWFSVVRAYVSVHVVLTYCGNIPSQKVVFLKKLN